MKLTGVEDANVVRGVLGQTVRHPVSHMHSNRWNEYRVHSGKKNAATVSADPLPVSHAKRQLRPEKNRRVSATNRYWTKTVYRMVLPVRFCETNTVQN